MVWVILFPFVILPAHDWIVQHVHAVGDAVFVVSLRAGSEWCFLLGMSICPPVMGTVRLGHQCFLLIFEIRDIGPKMGNSKKCLFYVRYLSLLLLLGAFRILCIFILKGLYI